MNPIAVTAIQAMVALVVLITTGAILSGALLAMYGSVNDRMRAMDRERLDILTGAVAVLVLSVIAIGVAVTGRSAGAGTAALVLVLVGTVTLLGGLLFAARSIMISMNAIDYEVRRALSLGS